MIVKVIYGDPYQHMRIISGVHDMHFEEATMNKGEGDKKFIELGMHLDNGQTRELWLGHHENDDHVYLMDSDGGTIDHMLFSKDDFKSN